MRLYGNKRRLVNVADLQCFEDESVLRIREQVVTLDYLTAKRTNGANPFKIFEAISEVDQTELHARLKAMRYLAFLETAYWFAVSMKAKAWAKMRCQVCDSMAGIQVHHRTYSSHGAEHLNMWDLVVLCGSCHGIFHGHRTPAPVTADAPQPARKRRGPYVIPHSDSEIFVPDSDPIILTQELIDNCRANGSFTSATLNALQVPRPLRSGWGQRLLGKAMPRAQYREAVEGRYVYRAKRKSFPDR